MKPYILLRSAAGVLAVTGFAIVGWFIDKALIHPWDRIVSSLYFWIPFLLTVVLGLVLLILLFLKAAQRAREFNQEHF